MISRKAHFVLIHGTGGDPAVNWLPWLASKLQSNGSAISVPSLPTPDGQNLQNWQAAFYEQVPQLNASMVLVGHSMGAGLILRLLESSDSPVRASILVSGWDGLLEHPDFDPLIFSFYQTPFKWDRIRANSPRIHLFHGDDDPYVPHRKAQDLADKLQSPLTTIVGGGHLNAAAGFDEFPALLEKCLAS
jgi:predicted alpha/beta hydrolase family esterase